MKKVFSHEVLASVILRQAELEKQGIKTVIRNEFLSGGVGELSPLDTWPELWILNPGRYEQAMRLIAAIAEAPERGAWVCPNCAEQNEGSFEYCWRCTADQPDY